MKCPACKKEITHLKETWIMKGTKTIHFVKCPECNAIVKPSH